MHMTRTLRFGMVATVLLASGWLTGCNPGPRLNANQAPALEVAADDLAKVGLRQFWADKLILPPGDSVQQARLLGDQLVVVTRRNFCYAVDAKTGEYRILAQIAPESAGVFQPPCSDGVHYFFAGTDRLIGMNIATGTPDIKITLEMPSRTRAMSDKEFVYTGSLDGKIFAYAVDSQVKHWNSKVGPAVTSLDLSKGNLIAARSDVQKNRGELLSIRPKQFTENWTQFTDGPIRAPIAATDDAVFVASEDGSLYRFNSQHGWSEWRVRTGAILLDSPLLLSDKVIQLVPGVGTWVVHKTKGDVLWTDKAALQYLGQSKDGTRMYAFDGSNLIVKNPNTGKTLAAVRVHNMGGVITVPDPDNTKLYLLDTAGRMLCLNDINLPYLVVDQK
ncbi:MAG: PQQ-binding-like beta-propeller repeat protein [Phycisphaerae bacterium]|nr:PQQ-binding-like beta-propeller repeat protein [Phycisphaerae bacterium]